MRLAYLFFLIVFMIGLLGVVPEALSMPRGCKKSLALDGSGGFLWKESDHTGTVVLFPQFEQTAFDKVLVVKKRNMKKRKFKKVAELSFSGFANGNRQHWRDPRSITQFPNKPLVVKTVLDGKKTCYRVPNPHERQD
jgi:hypothetical protein